MENKNYFKGILDDITEERLKVLLRSVYEYGVIDGWSTLTERYSEFKTFKGFDEIIKEVYYEGLKEFNRPYELEEYYKRKNEQRF